MSNSGGAPGLLDTLPLGNDNQNSQDSGSSPSNSGSSPSNSGSSPPSNGQNPSSPPDSSSNSPPSPDGSSSIFAPPSGSNSNSPSPQSSPSNSGSSSTPPPDSNSSPPSGSGSSPPPSNSDSSTSPPPSGSNTSPPPPQSNSDSSPPPSSGGGSNSPPSPPPSKGSQSPSSPPSSNNPLDSPPAESLPPPGASNDSPPPPAESRSPPPPDNQQPPATGNPSPLSRDSPPAPTSHYSPPSPSSRTSEHVPELSPPSTRSSHSSSTPTSSSSTHSSDSSGSSSAGTVAGVTVAGVLIIALIGLFFVIARKRKRRSQAYYEPYGPPPPNFSMNADGYYYGQPHSQQHTPQHSQQYAIGISGNSHEYYGGKPPPIPAGINSYGSYKGPDSGVLGGSKSCFTYEELMGITEGFSRQNVIGEGGFGAVYKGSLPDGKVVAVKQLKAGSGQGEREFRAEVEIISRVHHRHLVSLVGYCIAESQRLLVYEFVPNNTLEHHLHGQGVPVMEWSKRLKMAVGAARGLAYLHEDCHPKIIHRDIKSANILVDDFFEAQVADFGLAKLSNDTNTHVSTRVMGTFGYMAPEYASSGKLTDRSDVFSFGVVLLELVTGRKPVDQDQPLGDESLVEWARPVLQHARETGDYSELADPRLEKRYVEQELIRMAETAAACVRHSAPKRPRMVQVLRALDTDGDMPDISNGVKVGQSTIFECGPNSDLQKFRMMAFGSDDSSEYDMYSGNLNSREMPPKPPGSAEFTSGESETRAINPRRGY